MHLNGQRVGQDELTPGWTEYRKRVYYQTYDVTDLLKTGDNAIGAILGDGWYASDLAFTGKRKNYGGDPRLLVQLVVELADGSTQTIVSDASWKAATGPIRHADLLLGCEYDARVRMDGWDRARLCDGASDVAARERRFGPRRERLPSRPRRPRPCGGTRSCRRSRSRSRGRAGISSISARTWSAGPA